MKTISLKKKVAAVAVASLGLGLLSVAPAKADAVTSPTLFTSIALARVTAAPVVGTAVDVNFGGVTTNASGDGAAADADTIPIIGYLSTVPAGGNTTAAANATGAGTDTEMFTAANVTEAASGSTYTITITTKATANAATTTPTASTGAAKWTFTPQKAGVHVLTVWVDSDGNGLQGPTEISTSLSITVAAAATYSNTLSTAFISYGAGNTAPTADTTAAPVNQTAAKGGVDATNDKAASIDVVLKGTGNAAYTSGAKLSAEITGPGYLVWENAAATGVDKCLVDPTYGANVGRSLAARAVDDQSAVFVCADGTAGVATVTIKITDADDSVYTLATRTVTFFGAVSKIVATGVLTIGRAGGASVTGLAVADRNLVTEIPSVIVYATDSAGNGVTGLTITAVSSNTAVMNSALPTVAEDVKSAANIYSSGGAGYYNIETRAATGSVSGSKATMTFRVVDPAGDGTTFLTSAVDFTVGGSVATETLSFDKASYAPGEAMVVTRTAKDSAGNPVYDGAASPEIKFSKAVGGSAPAAGIYVKGVSASSTSAATATVFAPVTPGAFSATATSGATGGPTITASSAVADPVGAQIAALVASIAKLQKAINKINKRLAR